MSESLKQKSMKGIIWSFANRSSIQIVQFIVSMVLARLLTPEDYGVVGLAYVAIALVECFTNLGIGGAIVQKKEVDELDYNTFFWTDTGVRVFVFVFIFLLSPSVASYYGKSELIWIIRVIAINVPLGILTSVPILKLTRAMDFRTTAWIGVTSRIISCSTGLFCAYRGFGVWSLVIQNVTSGLISTPLTLAVVPWIPKLQYSKQRFRQFFSYGSKMMISGIMDTVYNNITGLIIGKAFSVESLGYYSKGQHVPQLVVNSVNSPINNVSFPMLSKLQSEPEKFKNALRKSLKTSLFFISPMMMGLFVVAKPLIVLLYGSKWIPAVPFLRIMALVLIFHPVHTLNLTALMGLGRSDLFLKLEILKKIVGIATMALFLPFGLTVFVSSKLLNVVTSVLINTSPMKKLIGYTTWQQLCDIVRALAGSIVMALIILPLNLLDYNQYLIMSFQIPMGIAIYFLYSWLFNRELLKDNCQLLLKIALRK